MAAYCSHTDDREMFEACRNVFDSIRNQQMYLTAAVGATRHKEAFTKPYHLPNDRAYGETCASAALVFAMRRMLLNEPGRRLCRRDGARAVQRAARRGFV